MAIRTGSTTSNGSFSNLSISGTTTNTRNITWSTPTLLDGASIVSTSLTFTLSTSMTKGSATVTVNGTTYTAGTHTINLETSLRTSVAVTARGGNKNARGTVSISSITYTVNYQYDDGINEYTVTFVDWNGTVLKTQTVIEGESATPPSNPSRTGYTFTDWQGDYTNVTSNVTITATYTINTYTVRFVDYDGTEIYTETVQYGGSATPPLDPSRTGYNFTGWNGTYTNVTSNVIITATYTEVASPNTSTIRIGEYNVSKIFLGTINILRVYSGSQLIWGSASSEIGKPIYYGRLSISEVGGSVIQYNSITDTMIKSGTNITRITSQTLNRKSVGKQSTTSKGDYIIVAVPNNEGYIVKKDNGLGDKVMFDEDVAGANGVILNINENEYAIYGEILISPAEIFIYIDKN